MAAGAPTRDEAAALRAEPKRWALLAEVADSNIAHRLADNINRGNLASFRPPGSFEARSLGRKGLGAVRGGAVQN